MRTLCLLAYSVAALAQTPVFRADTNLQSIAVQVTDKQGRSAKGLTASDFILLEDGKPQQIAFFGSEQQPTTLAVLVDSSSSMRSTGKLDRARALLEPLLHVANPEDEIFLVPFTDRLLSLGGRSPFTQLGAEQRLNPPEVKVTSAADGGTALYDSLASTLCHLRTAQNVRQAVVVITDGADQNSRLRLEQLVQLTRSSNAQIFLIGFFDKSEYQTLRQSGKTMTLMGEREIDNPLFVFERLARESGAESFFPASAGDLRKALARISAILEAQYTLAYYPKDPAHFRRIEVRVKNHDQLVVSRRGVGSEPDDNGVHFQASSCEVSAKQHPYPWESRTTVNARGLLTYHEDFSDPRTGWPNREAGVQNHSSASLRYVADGYELSRGGYFNMAAGFIFHMGPDGYYALLLSGHGLPDSRDVAIELVKRTWQRGAETVILPWAKVDSTGLPLLGAAATDPGTWKLSIQYIAGRIQILVNDREVATTQDASYPKGFNGLALFGSGRAVFHDLLVEDLP